MNCLIDKLRNLKYAVLELDLSQENDKKDILSRLKSEITGVGYEVSAIYENQKQKGLYHIHLKKQNSKTSPGGWKYA